MKKSRYFLIFIVIFFMTIFIANPIKYSTSIITGVKLFFINVFPTLFPFILFTKILNELDFSKDIARFIGKPLDRIFHTGYYSGYVFIISLFCGYPVSSKILYDLYSEGKIDKKYILPISSYTTNFNPLFIIGTIGGLLLKNTTFSIIILLSHYISSIVNGLIFATFGQKSHIKNPKKIKFYNRKSKINIQLFASNTDKNSIKSTNHNQQKNTKNYNLDLDKTMTNGIISILSIGGYICIFSMIIDGLIDCRFIDFCSNIFTKIFGVFGINNSISFGSVISIFEVTRGVKELCVACADYQLLLPLICFAVSFGGLSMNMQAYSYIQKCEVKFSHFIIVKFVQGLIAYSVCYLICLLYFNV